MDGGYPSKLGNPRPGSNKVYGVTTIYFYRRTPDGLELLFQKRGEKVDKYPGEWDAAAGGHINFGESILDAARREAREEIGAEITTDDLEYVCSTCRNQNSIYWAFCVDWTDKADTFHFDDGEVSEVRWVPYRELNGFLKDYVKKPLREDTVFFAILDRWLKDRGHC
ncbi:NUDIX domain-containing protein [Candidatus Saccharibacteria bacterium]|nr:NUDIX domain-containing protein [Candidatus Saccharibacteria bacterium]